MLAAYLCIQLLPLLIYCQHVAQMLFAPDEHLLSLKGAQPNSLQQTEAEIPSTGLWMDVNLSACSRKGQETHCQDFEWVSI